MDKARIIKGQVSGQVANTTFTMILHKDRWIPHIVKIGKSSSISHPPINILFKLSSQQISLQTVNNFPHDKNYFYKTKQDFDNVLTFLIV